MQLMHSIPALHGFLNYKQKDNI